MKKFTLIVFALLAFGWQADAQSIVIGTGTVNTGNQNSNPVDGYFNSYRYQVVYTAAELNASLTPFDEITGLGWSVSDDYAGGNILGYTIKMGHTSATNSAAHDASSTIVVKNAFDYDPTLTVAGVFDMIAFDTNFVWNGVDNVLVEVCSDGQNPFSGPYGQVRATNATDGSRRFRTDGSTSCGVNTNTSNPTKPNIQFDYIDGIPPACLDVSALNIDSFNASSATVSWTANNGETNWEIAFQASGAGEPVGAGTATTSNPHFQLSLTGSTAYDVYVRADCGGGDISDWVGPASFTTFPSAVPNCVTTYNSAPDAACGNFDTALSWTGVVADGYFITVGTTMGGNDIMDNVDLGNVTLTTITTQTAGTTYYYTISPYNVVGTNTTCTEQTYSTFATGCLCDSIPTSNDNNGISNVRVGLTDYATTDVTYFDHSGTAEQLGQGLNTNLEITFETGFTYGVNVWIDFNDNSTLEAGELVHNGESLATNPTTYQADFTMPAAAALGTHKMRIVTDDTVGDAANPCNSTSFGVTLDFDIEVTAVACTSETVDSVTIVENCAAGTYVVNVEVSDLGTGAGASLFIWGASFPTLIVGTNTAGPFTIGVASGDIIIFHTLDNTCSNNLGDFIYDDCPPPLPVGVTCTGPGPEVVFTEDFDAVGGWTGDINSGNDSWEIPNDAGSANTGADTAFSSGSYMNWEASGANTNTGSIVSPGINLTTAAEQVELAFYMHAYGAEMGTLNVGVSTVGAAGPFTNEFTWTGDFQTSGADAWAAVGVDLSAYIGSVIHIQFSQTGASGFAGDMSIDAMTVTACGTFCSDPSAIAASNITATTADVAWTENGSATAWEIVVQAAGTGEPAAADGSGTDTTNPYNATGLTGETDYEVYVRAECTAGTTFSLWTGPFNFTTPCGVLTPDYTADMSVNVPDACWDEADDGEVAAGPSGSGTSDWTTGSYGVGSSNKVNLFQGNTDREWLLSPTFDLSGGTYQLEVNVAVTNFNNGFADDTMGSDDEVQLLSSIDGGTTWVNLTTWNAANEPDFTGTEYTEDLSAYTGNTQFAIWASDGAGDDTEDYDFHVGKFVVRTPPTCGDVSAITIDSFTDSTASISWTDAEGETDWEIAVQAAGTGAPGIADNTGTDTATNPYAASGLTGATAYEVYVRADCSGDGSNLGAWIGTANFTTLATPPNGPTGVTCTTGSSSTIFTEDFDAVGGWTGNFNGGDGNWEIPNDSGSGGTGADAAFSSGSFMNYEASGGTTATASAVSPAIDLTAATPGDAIELAFYMHAFGDGTGTLNVGISTTGVAGPFTTEFTWTGELQLTGADAWVPVGVDLSAYQGSTINVEFSHTGINDFAGDISIDAMTIEACGAFCVDPTAIAGSNITGTTADIAWTENGSASAWEVAVQAPGTGEPAAADGSGADTTNPYSAIGLTPLTNYEVYVRAECTAGTTFSGWAGPYNFTTTELCPDVTGLTIDSFSDTTAEISWTNGGGTLEAGWEIVVQADGTGAPAGAGAATTSPHSESGLTAETAYEVYVRANCAGDGFSNWVGPVDFTTACAPLTPDYAADFSTNAPDAGACWEEAGDGEVAAGPSGLGASDWTTGSYGFGNSNRINLFGSSDREWLLSPGFDLSADGYELVVNVAVSNWNDGFTADAMGSDDEVQLLMSTDGGATWSNLTTWNAANEPVLAGTEYVEDLTGNTGTNVLFAIMASDGTTDDSEDYDFHIGRFEVRTPPSCPDVSAVTVSSITATSASIGWTNGGGDTLWEVAVQAAGTGEPAAANDSGTDTTNPYSAGSLTPETAYEVYVRADCGATLGNWIGPVNFATPCAAITPDYTADMSNNVPDSCWEEAGSGEVAAGPGGLGASDWNDNRNYGGTASNSINLYQAVDREWLLSPGFDLSTGGPYQLEIEVAVTDFASSTNPDTMGSDDEVQLVMSTDGGATWSNLTTWNAVSALPPTGTEYIEDLTGNTGTNVQFAVWASDGNTDDSEDYDFHVGKFVVRAIPTCPDVAAITVSNITTTSADIGWTNGGGESNWEVAVQAPGTGEPAAADGSGANSATNPYNATGLASSTNYEVYVRAECTVGVEFGAWVGPFNFATDCDTFSTFPYSEGFESGVPPTCWTSFRGTNDEGTGFDWTTSATANSGSASAFVRYENVTNSAQDWLVTPAFDLSALTNPELSFFARESFGSDFGSVHSVQVSTTDTAIASFTAIQSYTEADFSDTTFEQFTVDLSAYSSDTTVYIAFVLENDDGDSWFIDDVLIKDNIPGTYTYTDGTWTPGDPGNDLDDIIIASGNFVVSSDFTCNSMTVNPGASVTVNGGTTLEATNGLSLESSSTSYSSLIRNGSIVGAMSYDRHVNINGSGTTGSNDLISAPLTGQQFSQVATNNPNILNNGTLYLFGPFEKVTGSFVTWAGTETATLDAGVGYRAATSDNGSVTFSGTAENGVVTNDIVNAGSNNAQWNLVGNPYPSYLAVQQFLVHDVGGVVNIQLFDAPTAAIYGYDGTALNGWTVYNLANTTPSTIMAPGQGFFVSADATNAPLYDLEFTPAMRVTGSGDDFISGRNAQLTYVKLNASTANNSYNTEFYFNANATEGFDIGYDAAVWGDTTPDFALYSHLIENNAGDAITLQALNSANLNDVTIPLGVNANQGEQLTFSIADMTLPASVNVYLDDIVANTTTLLNDSEYVFTPTTDLSGTGRFFLRTSEDALSTIDNSLDNLNIFTLKASDELVISGELLDNTMLTLYDIQGRLVLSTKLDNTLLQNRIDVSSINSGVYIVTVQNNSQEKTKKVIID